MDVKLTGSSSIPYLTQGCIERYCNLKFYTKNGDVVKMNPLMLAALNSSLVDSISDFDSDECCVITEFSKCELEEVHQFSWTGQCKNLRVFHALGIDLNAVFYHDSSLLDLKMEVKDEDFAIDNDDNEDPLSMLDPCFTSSTTKKKSLECNWTNEQLKLYESYELPKPLEAYKVPSLKPKSKANINNADVFSLVNAEHMPGVSGRVHGQESSPPPEEVSKDLHL